MTDDISSSNRIAASDFTRAERRDPDRPPELRLAINEQSTPRWSFEDDAYGYREAGFEGIGVLRSKISDHGEERGAEFLRDLGLSVSSVSDAGGFTGANGNSLCDALADARDALRVAGMLRAESLVVMSGSRAGHIANHARRLVVDSLLQLADRAARLEVALALQPIHLAYGRKWTFLNSIDAALEILDRCNHPSVKMAFNTAHLWSEPGLLERIPEITPRIALVQLGDWRRPPRFEDECCLPGDGEIPLAEITGALLDSGYQGFFEINVWSDELWRSDYQELLSTCFARCCSLDAAKR